MARHPRMAPGGLIYHVLNRSVGRIKLFRTDRDFQAFHMLFAEAHKRLPIRILSYCVMPTHWHFVVWPRVDGELSDFFRWLTHTHAMRWRVAHNTVGYGPLYQGRFKSFPVQDDAHLLTACRYVERNALTAGLVQRAEQWQWGSLWLREQGSKIPEDWRELLCRWPVPEPRNWLERVNEPLTEKELDRIKLSVLRNRPLGDETWVARQIKQLHMEHTLRPEGRPKRSAKS